jgi:hypothetical protein
MKATVVPAQVTTVEDRVAGNLGFSQLILFAIPVFGGSLFYAVLPPSMSASAYKLVIIGIVAVFSSVFAIRFKGKILLLWMIVLLRYNLRPKFYLFNKNTNSFRENYPDRPVSPDQVDVRSIAKPSSPVLPKLDLVDSARAFEALDDPLRQLRYETTKKGGLYVRYTEIEE